MLIHESTYRPEAGFASRIHRARLDREIEVLNELKLPKVGRLADFGCSNGFLLETIQRDVSAVTEWEFVGFDRQRDLLALAEARGLPRTTFRQLDLNSTTDVGQYDLVTCFETLEHVGDFQTAVRGLLRACADGGHLVISVPYEIGIPGLAKFLGRMVLRKNAYRDFFDNRSKFRYFMTLLLGRRTDVFREPPQEAWGPHLGFDNSVFESFLRSEAKGFDTIMRRTSFLGFNVVYAFRRGG